MRRFDYRMVRRRPQLCDEARLVRVRQGERRPVDVSEGPDRQRVVPLQARVALREVNLAGRGGPVRVSF